MKRERIKRIRNKKKAILAKPVAAPAIPLNPKKPAIKAIIINVIVQRNIFFRFFKLIIHTTIVHYKITQRVKHRFTHFN